MQIHGFTVKKGRVFFQGLKLNDSKTVADYRIGNMAILQAKVFGSVSANQLSSRKVGIQKNQSEAYWYNYESVKEWTTQDLIPAAAQDLSPFHSLIFRGRILTIHKLIHEYKEDIERDPNLLFMLVPTEKCCFYNNLT